MSDYLSADELVSSAGLPEDDVIVARGKVRVRGLSRSEVFMMQKAKDAGQLKDEGAWERRMVSLALVAPSLTEIQVGDWQATDPAGGDLEAITDKIAELSGMKKGADKSRLPDVRDESRDGVRVLPRDEAAHDGGAVEGVAV